MISPDSRRVVYWHANPESLSSVPIDGAPIVIGPLSRSFDVTPDGRTVVFVSNAAALYRVPIDGSAEPEPVHHVAGVDSFFRFTRPALEAARVPSVWCVNRVQIDGSAGPRPRLQDHARQPPRRVPGPPGGSVRRPEPYPWWNGDDYFTRLGMRGRAAVYQRHSVPARP